MKKKEERFDSRRKMIFWFLKGSKRYFFIAIVAAMVTALLDLVNPRIISFTVDAVLDDQSSSVPIWLNGILSTIGGTDWLRSHLWAVGLAVVLIALLGAVCRYVYRLFNAIGAEKFVKNMRDQLFDHIQHLPFSWHSENKTGDIIQRCTSDVDQIKTFVSEQLTNLFRVILVILLALASMLSINRNLTLAAVIYIPVIVGYSLFFHSRIGSAFEKADVEEGKLSSIAQENLTGVRVVRAFGREEYERERFEKQNAGYTRLWIRMMRLMAAFWSSSDLFSYLQVITVMAMGVVYCVHGVITPGDFIAMNSYTAMMMWPIRSLGRVIAGMSRAGISIDRLRYIMNSEEEKDATDAVKPDMHQDIVFDHVSFAYEDSGEILDDVSFIVKAGSTVGILGGTGSGKSTLMYLLDRLYPLNEKNGRILIGDTNVQKIQKDWLRENIGMVLQEPYLFSRTLEENIAIAKEGASHAQVERAAHLAALDRAVDHFKQGYETTVGERGVTLSGGQKQRTAIAQMLIRKPPVMVFDDSLSAVDAETDARIRHGLKEAAGNSTVILIAHRITTLMDADQIIVMDHGHVSETGTHKQLIRQPGIYRDIYDLQIRNSLEGSDE